MPNSHLVPQYGAALKELRYIMALPELEIAKLTAVQQLPPEAPDMATDLPLDGK